MTATLPRSAGAVLVTPAALERMHIQLAELKSRRPVLLDAIRKGFAGGDSADQALFVEEVSGLTQLDEQIAELETRIANAVVTERSASTGRVEVGSVVTVRFAGESETERYIVGGPELAEDDIEAVSPQSPMGLALLGAAPGQEVSFQAPRGSLVLTVVDC